MSRLVISGATIIDTYAAQPAAVQATLVIENDRIIDTISPTSVVEGEAIDAKGLYAIPGLIDLHLPVFHTGALVSEPPYRRSIAHNVDSALKTLKQWLGCGVTSVRVPGAHDGLDLELRDALKANDLRAPRVFASGMPIAGVAGDASALQVVERHVAGPDEARRATRLTIKGWADQVQVYADSELGQGRWVDEPGASALEEKELAAVVEEAHHAGVTVFAHATTPDAVRRCLAAGVDVIEHAPNVDDDALALFKSRGAFYLPALASAGSLAARTSRADGAEPWIGAAARQWEAGRGTLGRAIEAGVGVLVGSCATDSDMSLWKECEWMSALGATPFAVLRAATAQAAAALGQARELGALQKGQLADLVLLAENPLDNIANLRSVVAIVRAGKLVVGGKEGGQQARE